jgi:hypothetical protein
VSPTLIRPLSAATEAGAHDVRAHQNLLIRQPVRHRRQVPHWIGDADVFRLAAVDRVAEPPAAERLGVALWGTAAALGLVAIKAGQALAARRDGANDDALAELVARYARTQLLDDPDRFVADNTAALDGVLALEDVDVRAADRRRGDTNESVARPDLRHRLFVKDDAAGLDEHGCRHGAHDRPPSPHRRRHHPFTARTSQGGFASISSATLPSSARAMPVRPCVPSATASGRT